MVPVKSDGFPATHWPSGQAWGACGDGFKATFGLRGHACLWSLLLLRWRGTNEQCCCEKALARTAAFTNVTRSCWLKRWWCRLWSQLLSPTLRCHFRPLCFSEIGLEIHCHLLVSVSYYLTTLIELKWLFYILEIGKWIRLPQKISWQRPDWPFEVCS